MNDPLSILIIEDDADTLANLCDILELDGHHVVGRSSFADAQEVARSESFSIAITDRMLPEGMIEDLLPELIRMIDGAEIIVVTGYADMKSTITAFRMGVTDYVIKPIIPDDLRSTVKRIAEKKRLENALAREHAFADLVVTTAEAIVLVLDLQGNVMQFNPYFEQLTGWSLDELRGKDWFEMCVVDSERERIKEVFVATANDVKTRGIVNSVKGKDGKLHQIRWSNTTLDRGDGCVNSVLAVGVDVSDLTTAQQRALQAERLAAIGQTMTALAHESRNALQRIQAASEMLELEVGENVNAQKDLRAIQRANKDLQCLLEEVRSFAAPIQLRREPVRLPDIWRRVWEDLTASHRDRNVELVQTIDTCNVDVQVDILRMEQVFRNLFENALAACQDPVRIQLKCVCENDEIRLTICDNGPGLQRGDTEKLFQPFFTTKQTGTGLGLSICQRIVEAHHGEIETVPTPVGACFEIRLPRKRLRNAPQCS